MDVKSAHIHMRLMLAIDRGLPPNASGIDPHVVERLLMDSSLNKYSRQMKLWEMSVLIYLFIFIFSPVSFLYGFPNWILDIKQDTPIQRQRIFNG